MKYNRKGDIGFPEAMMAVMIVSVILTAYLGAFVLNTHNQSEDVEFDENLIDGLTITEGKISGDPSHKLTVFMEKHGYRGVMIRCTIPDGIIDSGMEITVGTMDGNIENHRFIKNIKSDDSRVIAAIFEVAVCV
jgi:hypothetical protein